MASIQFDVYAAQKKLAHDIAERARLIIASGEGHAYDLADETTAVLTGTVITQTLGWEMDPMNLKPRYTFRAQLTTHLA